MALRKNKQFPSLIVFAVMTLSACSSVNNPQEAESNQPSIENSVNKIDSLESFNRGIFKFNKGLDSYLLKPAAIAYKAVTPEVVDTSVTNFFQNIGDVSNAFNNVLQLKFGDAASDTERFVFNTVFGFAGLVDVASAAGLPKHEEDFGQTLATWGVGSGPYIMLPFLGPSTIRDATARVSVDRLTNLTSYSDDSVYYLALDILDTRADFFAEEEVLKGLSDDQYSALRDVWLQRRVFLIKDGKVETQSESDLIDELESLDLE